MQDEDLAYTPHPAHRRKALPTAVVGVTRREAQSGGIAMAAAAVLTLAGTGALMSGSAAAESSYPAVATEARPFEARPAEARALEARPAEAAAPVRLAAQPSAVELRPSSPLPFAGDALGPDPAAAPGFSFSPAREQHVLTSFDGTRTMADGPTIVAAGPSPSARREPMHAPVVWNNPVKWISVHKEGL